MTRVRTSARIALALLFLAPTAAAGQRARTESPHGRTRRPLVCDACHTLEGWRPLREDVSFDHRRDTGQPLTGTHADIACGGCHLDLRFAEPATPISDCAACHADVHQGRLGRDCASCHDTRSFHSAARVDAHARGVFPLTGAHERVTCESCHVSDEAGAFRRLPTDCFACHERDYRDASTIDHVAAQFQTDCRDCHGTSFWGGARFDHAAVSNGFALLGAHATLPCTSCHRRPDNALLFQPPPTGNDDCIACHRAGYTSAHGSSGYPTTCADCHNPSRWDDASFDHDQSWFPIFSGAHAGRWNRCSDCHTDPSNYVVFSCFACHSQPDMDAHHQQVNGYAYDSALCYSCHPRGRND